MVVKGKTTGRGRSVDTVTPSPSMRGRARTAEATEARRAELIAAAAGAPLIDSSSSSSSSSSANSSPTHPPNPPVESEGATAMPETQNGQRLGSPDLPSPNLDGINLSQPLMEKVRDKVRMCNQRITDLTDHVNNTDGQITQVNAILREQSQTLITLTDAMPAIQEGVATLRLTIQNDVTTKLRDSEEAFRRTIAVLRRETNTALTTESTLIRDAFRITAAQVAQLQDAPDPEILIRELRNEVQERQTRDRDMHIVNLQALTNRVGELERKALIMEARVDAANVFPRETGARPRTQRQSSRSPERQRQRAADPDRGEPPEYGSPPPSYSSATRPQDDNWGRGRGRATAPSPQRREGPRARNATPPREAPRPRTATPPREAPRPRNPTPPPREVPRSPPTERVPPRPQAAGPGPAEPRHRIPADIRDELQLELDQIREEMQDAYAQYGRTRIEVEKQLHRVSFTSRYFRWKEITKEIMPLLTLQAKGALRRLETQVEIERLNIAPPLMQNHAQAPRVRIDPPKFYGDCLKYYGWRNTWNTFHESPSYTDSERSQLLEAALQGEAKTATERFTFSADTYHNILQFLADRFGNRSTIVGKLEARLRLAASNKLGEDCTASQLREKHISISNERQGDIEIPTTDHHGKMEAPMGSESRRNIGRGVSTS
ncbi:hypothetical protein DAPPUDRAFT_119613 [Daphnia pulex]|uniref:Uncharacterized protein n=1 Tax=Daphnia pulex TaxID=6669 RepID=E9HZ12_DAPPU|nr:hypothetical protein DAPPUDRAFT_119613 [Daphnia pulex]|eukprot:EFX63018.1 hypothetical protein DAPPUDRAFT_119613 [Daphnia pulex]